MDKKDQARLEVIKVNGGTLRAAGYTLGASALGVAALTQSAMAVDVDAITGEISSQKTNVIEIGGAILLVIAVVVGIAMLRRVMK